MAAATDRFHTTERFDTTERFQLRGRLGRGSLAVVFRAIDLADNREVAVKVAAEPGPKAQERIHNEARVLAALAHPSIIGFIGEGIMPAGGPLAGRPFLVEELAFGTSLLEVIRTGPSSPSDLVPWALGMFEALNHIHTKALVHCDIKPANLMLSGLRRSPVRLVDFGIASQVGAAPQAGISSGTVHYMSPEQASGGAAHPAWDVYAMGLVLLELMTGEKAFPGTAVESLVARTLRNPGIPRNVGPGWEGLLRALTAMDPLDRPSAAEAAAWVGRLLPAVSRPDFTRRRRSAWFAGQRQQRLSA
ncbi:protein kinase domain-containing protein [Pseudarthrobacter sp. YALA5]|uniref:serine/threonine-protein kinase n=1 Tax=Pseudarthrobacter sp. DSP2-3-2b1 TaxID=2804661 RepID=UPI001038892B